MRSFSFKGGPFGMRLLILIVITFVLLSLSYVDGSKPKKKTTDKPDAVTKKPKTKKPVVVIKRTDFDEIDQWETLFPEHCSPTVNSAQSPINIETANAIRVNGDEQALLVFSGPPQKDLYWFSTTYINEGVNLEVLNLGPRKDSFRDTTYIAGAGSADYRYFVGAMFLFSKSELDPSRSGHQINGKTFPMEIVMTFADLPRGDDDLPSDVTQIHVMVDVQEASNPGFFFIADAWLQFSDLEGIESKNTAVDTNEAAEAAKKEVKVAADLLIAAVVKERKETGDFTYQSLYEDLERLYQTVKKTESTKALEQKQTDLTANTKVRKESADALLASRSALEKKLEDQLEEISRLIAAGQMLKSDRNEKTDKVQELKDDIQKINSELIIQMGKLQADSISLWEVTAQIRENKAILAQYKIGKEAGAQFKSVKDVKKHLEGMKEKAKEMENLKNAHLEKVNLLENELATPARNALIQSWFQASWMLPPYGGYYRYDGSGIVPPCRRRKRVLVLETPIYLSKEQLEAFQKMVKGRTQEQLSNNVPFVYLDKTLPILKDVGKREIFYQKKNLQFKLDDSLHMMSKVRRQIKEDMLTNHSPPLPFTYLHLIITLISSVINF